MPLDNQRLRTILPRPPVDSAPTEDDQGGSKARKRRRPYTTRACNFCREKKNACDGQPTCSQCLRRGIKCEYRRTISQTLLNSIPAGSQIVDTEEALSNADAADLLGLLKDIPDEDVLEAVQLLRSGNHPAEVGSVLRGYDAGLSQIALNRAILPPTQTSLEFELMMRHPIAYPTWAPFLPSKQDLEYLLLPSKICLDGSSPAATIGPSFAPSYFSLFGEQRGERSSGASNPVALPEPRTLYDNRLLGVDISRWTDLPITNEFSITVLSIYFETDHPMMPLFDVDLFLDGLLGKNQFCSGLLVNALFSWACQGYAAFEPEATLVGHDFYEEAKKIWKEHKDTRTDHICSVAAVQYLSITAVSLGAGTEYLEFHDDLLEMIKRLDLFDIDVSEVSRGETDDGIDWRQVKAQIAWALFNTVTLLSMHVHKRLVEHPPRFPTPDISIPSIRGNDISKEGRRREYFATLLHESCKLFLIVDDMVQVMYGPNPHAEAISLAFAEDTYKRFLSWADGLPLELAQGDQCTHHALVLHICYHLAILDLFRSLVRQNDTSKIRLRSFSSKEASPKAVQAASVNQLKRIVLHYRHSHPESAFSLFWHSALLYLSNAMLREANISGRSPEWRFYFRLCMSSYQTLYTCFRLAKGITLGLVSMALDQGIMNLRDAKAIRRDLELRGKHHDLSDRVAADLVVDLDLAVTDPIAAQAESLIQKLREIELLETDGKGKAKANSQ